jgi:ABC-type lipoprotein release transport system permease subunit
MSDFVLLLRIASRNIFASFLNVIIGLIILAGTLFFVVGGSLVHSMDAAMSRSIIGSVAGNAQIYAADSKDAPAIFDNWNLPDLEAIPDFAKVKAPLMQDPNIKAVVPMGISTAIVAYGNTVDQALEKLRNGLTRKPLAPRSQIESLKSHVRAIIKVIQGDYAKLSVVADKKSIDAEASQDLAKAASDEFWGSFDASPLSHLEFLENKIASLVPDADQIFLSYVGTDLDAYQSAFDRMQIVDGTAVPKGKRGMLLSKYVYENQFKLKIANRLDKINEALTEKGKKIATDPDLQDLVKQNKTQTREIVLQLDPLSMAKAVAAMQAATGSKETDVAKLLPLFLDTNDGNFAARYKAFYSDIAPLIELYRLKPGDTLTIKAYTKSGFVEAVNIKVYGTFQFKGLEKSGLAGALSLMDLMSFRDLYGYVTPEKIAETKALERAAGAKDVSRENAEADLFGGSNSASSEVGTGAQSKIDDKAQLGDARETIKSASLFDRVYTQDEIEKGVAIQAAIIMKDPSQLKQTMLRIQGISDKDKLNLKVVDWQKAAGNIGQFVLVIKLVLGIATAIIFVVALVIINNAVVMATLQRVREIGTLRAIGAQRGFVLAMVLTETMALGLAFGAVGAILGSGIIGWMGHAGIPAGNEFLYFFFSGPRLYPGLSGGALLGAFVVVLFVTCASALYPAIMATRVSPIQAMASED